MEPVTHVLTGACLARAGFNRKAAYATLTMAIAAELPDIDTVWSLRGPVEGFTHHRGITHTFVGLPIEAALLVGAVYAVHRWQMRRAATPDLRKERLDRGHPGRTGREQAPPRWGWLYLCALVALLSHLLLDYTNNYGLRPFYPFNPRWYAGSIVFIFDPLIFLLLLGALVLPALFAMVGAEVGARKQTFRGRGLARAALVGIALLWSLRAVEHQKAVAMAMSQSIAQPVVQVAAAPQDDTAVAPPEPPPVYLTAQRALASPDPLSPFHWTAATDFGPLYQLAEVDTWDGTSAADPQLLAKPDGSRETRRAQASSLGRAYMDWSPMPVIRVGDVELVRGLGRVRTITFEDPRFMGGWMERVGRDALEGTVVLNETGRVMRETIGGKIEQQIEP